VENKMVAYSKKIISFRFCATFYEFLVDFNLSEVK